MYSLCMKILLFKSYVICLYDAALWRRYKVDKLRSCYHKCMKYFFGNNRFDSVTRMQLETGLPSFDAVLSNCRVIFDKCVHMCDNMLVRCRCAWGLFRFLHLIFCIYFSQFCSVGMNVKFVSLFLYYLSVCFLCVSMGHVAWYKIKWINEILLLHAPGHPPNACGFAALRRTDIPLSRTRPSSITTRFCRESAWTSSRPFVATNLSRRLLLWWAWCLGPARLLDSTMRQPAVDENVHINLRRFVTAIFQSIVIVTRPSATPKHTCHERWNHYFICTVRFISSGDARIYRLGVGL